MKASIRIFIILVLLFWLTDRFVYTIIREMDKKVFTGQSGGKVNHFLSLKDSVNLLVFGSSRALHHLDTKVLDSSSYNMGVDGTRLGYSAALISTLNKKGQTIYVHIDPSAIFNSNYKAKDVLALLNVGLRDNKVEDFIKDIYPEEIYLSKIINCYVYNGKLLGLAKNYFAKESVKNYYGYDPIVPSKKQIDIFKKLLGKTDLSKFEYDNISENANPLVIKFISSIKDKCELNGSKLVFFTSPSLKINNKDLLLKTKEIFDSKDILYLDYSGFFEKLNIDSWKDFTHMSKKGADVFSLEMKKNYVLLNNK